MEPRESKLPTRLNISNTRGAKSMKIGLKVTKRDKQGVIRYQ